MNTAKAQNRDLEIRYLYTEKQQINLELYRLDLSLANTYDSWWPHIQHTIEEKPSKHISSKYKTIDQKRTTKSNISTKETPQTQHTFHPRAVNCTEIPFANSEMGLLQNGLKYNIHAKKKNWIRTLALEAETAVTQKPPNERDVYRKLIAERIENLQKQNRAHNTHPEEETVRSIQRKLIEHDAKVTGADKGNTPVTLPTSQCETKLQDFTQNNEFHTKANNPTKSFQTQIRSTIKQSQTPIDKDHRWKYINMSPSAPSIKGPIKIHKTDQPIRPAVNWRNASA